MHVLVRILCFSSDTQIKKKVSSEVSCLYSPQISGKAHLISGYLLMHSCWTALVCYLLLVFDNNNSSQVFGGTGGGVDS